MKVIWSESFYSKIKLPPYYKVFESKLKIFSFWHSRFFLPIKIAGKAIRWPWRGLLASDINLQNFFKVFWRFFLIFDIIWPRIEKNFLFNLAEEISFVVQKTSLENKIEDQSYISLQKTYKRYSVLFINRLTFKVLQT